MKKYRIKQIDNVFIPQVCNTFLDYIFSKWDGIDKDDLYEWSSEIVMKKHCSCTSFEEAEDVIKKHKIRSNTKPTKPPKQKIKYYRIK